MPKTPAKTKARAKDSAAKPLPPREHDNSPAVSALVAGLGHSLQATIEAVRRTILEADPTITEGTKWNSPSFYCHGWFVTIGCRKPTQLDIVLHCGAKVRADSTVREAVADPDNLLRWPSPDRALLSFTGSTDFRAKQDSFQRIVRGWAAYQKTGNGTA